MRNIACATNCFLQTLGCSDILPAGQAASVVLGMYREHIIPAMVHCYTQVLQRPDLIWHCSLRPIGIAAGRYNSSNEDILLDLVFFSPFEELRLRIAGIMESKGIHRVCEPSSVPTFYIGRVEDLICQVPLIPCFLDGNASYATPTIPHKYCNRQKDAFECGCAHGAGPTSRRGSHVYEINTWLWNSGRPQPRMGGLSVAKTEKL
jgi:hypothetical protein